MDPSDGENTGRVAVICATLTKKNDKGSVKMNRLYFFLLSAITVYAMIVQGLYFDTRAYPAFMMIRFLFLVWLLKHVLHKQTFNMSILLMIILPGIYALPLLFQPDSMLASTMGYLE